MKHIIFALASIILGAAFAIQISFAAHETKSWHVLKISIFAAIWFLITVFSVVLLTYILKG